METRLEHAGAIAAAPTPASSITIPVPTVAVPRNLLECPVCLQRFADARVLGRCGHTVCAQCVDGIRHSRTTASRCPICRLDFDDGDLHPNFAIQAIVGEIAPQTIAADRRTDIIENMEASSSSGTRSDERERRRREHTATLTSMFRTGTFPWWPTDEPITALIARTALADGRHGPILDIGAFGSLSGDRWAQEQARRAIQAGHQPTQRKLSKPLSVSGVGKGAQQVEWEVTLPIAVTDEDEHTTLDDYSTPVIPDSDVPGLLGLESIQKLRGVIDTYSNPPKLYCCGPGDYDIKLSPGSKTFPLFPAPSGHLILPTSEFNKIDGNSSDQPREQALHPARDEPMHLQALMRELREQGPPLDEVEATVQMD